MLLSVVFLAPKENFQSFKKDISRKKSLQAIKKAFFIILQHLILFLKEIFEGLLT